jgi:hypothetical protein
MKSAKFDGAAERADALHLIDGLDVGLEQAREQTRSTRHCAREVATFSVHPIHHTL